MAQSPLNDTTQPVDSEEEGRSPTTDRQWLIEKKIMVLQLTSHNSQHICNLSMWESPRFARRHIKRNLSSTLILAFSILDTMVLKVPGSKHDSCVVVKKNFSQELLGAGKGERGEEKVWNATSVSHLQYKLR